MQLVRRFRDSLGMSRNKFAREINRSPSIVETYEAEPPDEMLEELAKLAESRDLPWFATAFRAEILKRKGAPVIQAFPKAAHSFPDGKMAAIPVSFLKRLGEIQKSAASMESQARGLAESVATLAEEARASSGSDHTYGAAQSSTAKIKKSGK